MADGELRGYFRQYLPAFDWLAIESRSTGRGVPDSNYCHRGVEGWVEMKKANGHKVRVTPEQVGWAERRMRCGGRVFFAVRKRGTLWLFPGTAGRNMIDGPFDRVTSLGRWDGGPAAWDWQAVARLLTGLSF
jgi:hypothetical protein